MCERLLNGEKIIYVPPIPPLSKMRLISLKSLSSASWLRMEKSFPRDLEAPVRRHGRTSREKSPGPTLSRPHALAFLDHQSNKGLAPTTTNLTGRNRGRMPAYLTGGSPTPYNGLQYQTLLRGLNPKTMNVLQVKKLIAMMITLSLPRHKTI